MGARVSVGYLKKKWRQGYVRLLKSPGAPTEIALGIGLGLFIAMLPIMGMQMPIAVAVAEVIRRLTDVRMSRVAAAAGVWLTNPVTFIPIYIVCFIVGAPFLQWIFPDAAVISIADCKAILLAVTESSETPPLEGSLKSKVAGCFVAMTIGGVVLGIPLALIGYRFTLRAAERYQARVAARQKLRLQGSQSQMVQMG